MDKYKKDSLINIWKDANAYYSSGEEWTDEDAEFLGEDNEWLIQYCKRKLKEKSVFQQTPILSLL